MSGHETAFIRTEAIRFALSLASSTGDVKHLLENAREIEAYIRAENDPTGKSK